MDTAGCEHLRHGALATAQSAGESYAQHRLDGKTTPQFTGKLNKLTLKLDRPNIDFVALAKGMGVEGRAVANVDDFNKALAEYVPAQGPRLLEVQMA